MICAVCGTETPAGTCPNCGREVSSSSADRTFASPHRGSPGSPGPIVFTPGQAFGQRYTVVEELGAGGMGQVYKAIDRELGKTVALKLVSPEQASRAGTLERFKRELVLGQQVAHPNVCRVHDLGEIEGIRYISMEYVDGQTLADWIQAVGLLSPRQVVALARQICAGLEAIHQRGIVHRDLKPGNIMMDRSGHAVVMDFGLAYHREAEKLTAVGEVVGTFAYLSPEQARGELTDARSDLYSLGVLLFEMLTGRRPPGDRGKLPLALRDRDERCPPPSRFMPEVPAVLDAIVLRCLERDPAKRFQTAAEIERELDQVDMRSGPAPPPVARRSARLRWALVAAIALAAAALIFSRIASGPPRGPVAVALCSLAYEGPEDKAYLGPLVPLLLSEELRAATKLRVAPFASARGFRPEEDARSVARQLGVGVVVQGRLSVQKESFEATFTLLADEGKRNVWSKTMRGELDSLLLRVDGLAEEMAAELGAELTPSRAHAPEARARALEHYVEGRRFLEGWDVERNYRRAAEAFERAIQVEETFAEAHAGLALALWTHYEDAREPQLVERALSEAGRALTLSPSLSDAHLAMGVVELGTGRSAEAASSFQKAQELAPGDDAVLRRIADAYAALRKFDEAEQMYQRAIHLRPDYWENHNRKGLFHYRQGQLQDAQESFRQVIRLHPESDTGYNNLAMVLIVAGRIQEAEPLLQAALRINPSAYAHNNLGFVYYSQGKFEAAAEEFRRAIEAGSERAIPWGNLGDAYRQLGRKAEAQEAYARAIGFGETRLRINPADSESRAFLAMSLAGYGRCADAAREAARATSEASENPTIHYYAAVAYAICGDRPAALRHTAAAIEGGAVADVRSNPDLRPLLVDPSIRTLLR